MKGSIVMIAFGIVLMGSGVLLLWSERAREQYFFTKLHWWGQHAEDWTPAVSHEIQQLGGAMLGLSILVLGCTWLLS
jgi:hypothetical protein